MTVRLDDLPNFGVSTRVAADGTRVVAARGEVDLATAPDLAEVLAAHGADERALVLDLRETTFLDSSGIRVLVEAHRSGEERGVPFSVVAGTPAVRDLLVTTGVAEHLRLVEAPPGA